MAASIFFLIQGPLLVYVLEPGSTNPRRQVHTGVLKSQCYSVRFQFRCDSGFLSLRPQLPPIGFNALWTSRQKRLSLTSMQKHLPLTSMQNLLSIAILCERLSPHATLPLARLKRTATNSLRTLFIIGLKMQCVWIASVWTASLGTHDIQPVMWICEFQNASRIAYVWTKVALFTPGHFGITKRRFRCHYFQWYLQCGAFLLWLSCGRSHLVKLVTQNKLLIIFGWQAACNAICRDCCAVNRSAIVEKPHRTEFKGLYLAFM